MMAKKYQNFLGEKVLKLESFVLEVFIELFRMIEVTFLLDEVDEIAPSFQEFVLRLSLQIRNKSDN
jgi:hypothetical protein